MTSKILFLDDKWNTEEWKECFEDAMPEGVETIYESDGSKVLQLLDANPGIKVVFLDINFEGQEEQGEDILNKIKEYYPDINVIMLTSINSIDLVIRLVRDERKAFYYFCKDQLDPDQIKAQIQNAMEAYDNKDLYREAIRRTGEGLIIGQSLFIKKLLDIIKKVASGTLDILITGETGTGKELVARAIHLNSLRKGEFVAINCSAISKDLIESELFGHVKGAFTGAIKDKQGLFEHAEKGTLFLDEIGDMPIDLQPKLLRVLEDRTFLRIGDIQLRKANVRIVAATNSILEEKIKQNKFRDDLYYRLNVIPIKLAPLRERRDDIPLLANHYLHKFNEENMLNKSISERKEFSPEVLEFMQQCFWKGNIRELKSVIHRVALICDSSTININDLKSEISPDSLPENASINIRVQPAKIAGRDLVETWAEMVYQGKRGWQDIHKEFGRQAKIRKKIILTIILFYVAKYSERPSGEDLANLLKENANNSRQILASLRLKLTELDTKEKVQASLKAVDLEVEE